MGKMGVKMVKMVKMGMKMGKRCNELASKHTINDIVRCVVYVLGCVRMREDA